jgi:hypothetical protein
VKRPSPNNRAGAHRPAPPYPPIDPELCYPWRRLADWGFGGRGLAALKKAGLPVLRFHKQRFFRGSALISVLEQDGGSGTIRLAEGAEDDALDLESGAKPQFPAKKRKSSEDCC